MKKAEFPPSEALYPVPVVLVSCADKKRRIQNIITIAWCGVVCSNPPLISISIRPGRYSHDIIKDAGDFAVNIPTKKLLKKCDLCGILSGRDCDKFKSASLTAIPASKISSPLIQECPVNIECKVKDVLSAGSHDIFIGEVLTIHADTDVLDASGRINYKKAAPFVYNQGEYWDLGKKIGHYGCSKQL